MAVQSVIKIKIRQLLQLQEKTASTHTLHTTRTLSPSHIQLW